MQLSLGIDEKAIKDGFRRAKEDIQTNTDKIIELQQQIISLQNQLHAIQEKVGRDNLPNSSVTPHQQDIKATIKSVLDEMTVRPRNISISNGLNKKDIVKSKILETISDQQEPLPRLKEIIVDEQGFCSKASFYRYIEELKQDGKIIMDSNTTGTTVRRNKIQVIG
ncbi:hypothetical protein HYS47_03640 [Candidatus Woesearchaeota archaeon]|nr:hypothetical protein [Candidatus Woesearchaeota archaeon]